ncbi:MAG: M28 family peptidase [Thermoguttaceae bacterium]|nr:M28 family peptidase [Thermoguttaceae bacterium]MDW8037629.1 M28 family peptidase [Thermoguttaceae bacterium]
MKQCFWFVLSCVFWTIGGRIGLSEEAAEKTASAREARWTSLWSEPKLVDEIYTILKKVQQEEIRRHLFYLAKDPLPFRKLNYTRPGQQKSTLHEADDYITGQLQKWGYQVDWEEVMVQAFRRDPKKPKAHQYSPPAAEDPWYKAYNLYAERRGRRCPEEIILLLAHKDSQSWVDSPGANDNAIGTAGLMEIARVLAQYESHRTIRFLWCNEEHWPWTSVTAARKAKERGDNIIAVFNLDGIGVKSAEDTAAGKKKNVIVFTLPEGEAIARLALAANHRFQLGLEQKTFKRPRPGDDDGSFVQAGYPAAVVMIGSFPYADPNYHTEQDIPERTDVPNAAITVQLTLAVVLTLDRAP